MPFSLPDMSDLLRLLLTIPGACLAISIHESAHGWVAEKCGDPTARYAGRITLNPLKHFDPIGFLCMVLLHFGWAKPVPVNPTLYKNYRRDDIKVSLAGITANLCLFLVCFIVLTLVFSVGMANVPVCEAERVMLSSDARSDSDILYCYAIKTDREADGCITLDFGSFQRMVLANEDASLQYLSDSELGSCLYYDEAARDFLPVSDSYSGYRFLIAASGYYQDYQNLSYVWHVEPLNPDTVKDNYFYLSPDIYDALFGKVVSVLMQMVQYCMLLNLTLAVFNLIPLPPLDGYHVLNDLVLHRSLFAQRRTQQISGLVLLALVLMPRFGGPNIIGTVIGWVETEVTGALGSLVRALGVF